MDFTEVGKHGGNCVCHFFPDFFSFLKCDFSALKGFQGAQNIFLDSLEVFRESSNKTFFSQKVGGEGSKFLAAKNASWGDLKRPKMTIKPKSPVKW